MPHAQTFQDFAWNILTVSNRPSGLHSRVLRSCLSTWETLNLNSDHTWIRVSLLWTLAPLYQGPNWERWCQILKMGKANKMLLISLTSHFVQWGYTLVLHFCATKPNLHLWNSDLQINPTLSCQSPHWPAEVVQPIWRNNLVVQLLNCWMHPPPERIRLLVLYDLGKALDSQHVSFYLWWHIFIDFRKSQLVPLVWCMAKNIFFTAGSVSPALLALLPNHVISHASI